jgi:oligoendopeptidase F
MAEAQKATYGDGLDEQVLHPYMWAVKRHYYSTGLGFYNYPYAFGLLFSLSLYARSEAEGPQFARTYRELLRRTGSTSAADLGRSAGFDIEETDFWRKGIGLIAERVEDFEALIKDMK